MLSMFSKPVFNKQTSPLFLPARALMGPSGPCQFRLYPQRVHACSPPWCLHVPGRAAYVRAPASPTVPSTTQVSSVPPPSRKPAGALSMLPIPGFPLSPRGPRRGRLFPFYLLCCTRAARPPRIACSKQGKFFSSLTHSLVSVLVLLLCFSSPSLERGGGQQEHTGQVVLLPLLAY